MCVCVCVCVCVCACVCLTLPAVLGTLFFLRFALPNIDIMVCEPVFVKEAFLKLKSHIKPHTLILGDLNYQQWTGVPDRNLKEK